jgi:hypothetical protein
MATTTELPGEKLFDSVVLERISIALGGACRRDLFSGDDYYEIYILPQVGLRAPAVGEKAIRLQITPKDKSINLIIDTFLTSTGQTKDIGSLRLNNCSKFTVGKNAVRFENEEGIKLGIRRDGIIRLFINARRWKI